MKLKELGTIVTGNTPSKQSVENWDSPDICFVKPDIISDTGISIIDDAAEYISEKARAKARIVGENSILITCIGSIGKIGITAKGTFAFNQQINAIIPNRKVNSKYLAYALLYAKPRLVAIANAPVVPIINKSQFGDFEIKVTENTEDQSKAVEVLDTVNAIIENRHQQLQKLNELVKARFVELFGDPILNQCGWKKSPLEENATLLNGRAYKQDELLDSGKYPVLRVGNFFSNRGWYYSDLELDDDKYCDNGDLLYAWSASFGPQIWNGGKVIYHYHIWKIIVGDAYNKKFLCKLLEYATESLMSDTHGIAMMHLTKAGMEKTEFIVPPIDLQEQFAAFVEQVNKSKVAVQKSLDEAQLLFDSLMQRYFE